MRLISNYAVGGKPGLAIAQTYPTHGGYHVAPDNTVHGIRRLEVAFIPEATRRC